MGGIDWASEIHALCVVDEQGARVRERMVDHSEAGISALCRELVALGVERVAIERPDGILVDRLLEAGLTVIAVHPNQAKAARERYSVARGKSDRFDAFVLAELARTDAHRLRAIRPDTDETKALRALTRTRENSAPAGRAGELETEARRASVLGLVGALRPIVAEIAELTSQIRGALAAHPDGAIFAPLFRDAKTAICPATLIAELGDARERYPTDASLAADAGMSPVALESGKRRSATFRRACDKRLRVAVATLADSTRHWHPWAREVYRRARDRGQDHPHAIRTLGRAWLRVLWRCWRDRVPYDPALHGNFNRLRTAGG
jgi:uncharacterized protein with PIN domain